MPRNLLSEIQAAIASNRTHFCHLVTFTAGATTYRFAEDSVRHQGNLYSPGLRLASPIRYSQTLAAASAALELQNITTETAELLRQTRNLIQGASIQLDRLYLEANAAVTLFVGRIGSISIDERSATIAMAGDIDPTAAKIPKRTYSATCDWKFKDANCGYTDGIDPADPGTNLPFAACPKDFLSCTERGRQHRFPGFIHISRDLTVAVEGQAPDASPNTPALSALGRPWEEI